MVGGGEAAGNQARRTGRQKRGSQAKANGGDKLRLDVAQDPAAAWQVVANPV